MKLLLLTFACVACVAHAQIKNTGIKTHYPGQNTGNLILGNATSTYGEHNSYSETYNRPYVPADTYQGGSVSGSSYNAGEEHLRHSSSSGGIHYNDNNNNHNNIHIQPPRTVQVDATAEFINKTRSSMASGVCYKEVPTSSLIHDASAATIGNGTTPNMSKIQVCCEGYQRNPHVYVRCDPICHDDCPNGICTAPNTCVCIPGHIRNYEEKCISTCPLGCGNGICNERLECQCKPGYTIEPLNRQYCVPHCEGGCQYGKCVAPNKCDCFDGYRLTANLACEPKCDNCEFGKCTAPGFCSCSTGYLKVGGSCEPVCALGCNKGRCIAPDTCECSKGFVLDRAGSNCVPHCDQPCLNGVCNGDNSCTCNSGYVQDAVQRNICQPHCPQGCPNGYCTSPNFCVCKPGFIKSGIKGRQTCINA